MTEKIVGRLIDTNLELAGGINNRLPAVFDTVSVKVKSVTYPNLGIEASISIYNTTHTFMRGFGLVRLDEFANFIDFTSYDTWGDATSVPALIAKIDSTPIGYTLIFVTYHEPQTNTTELLKTLTRLGFLMTGAFEVASMWYGIIQKGSDSPLLENYKTKSKDGDFIEETIEIPKGIIHFPLDGDAKSIQGIIPHRYCPSSIRYIRDSMSGNSQNGGLHWIEVKAIDINGTNVALSKPVTPSSNITAPSDFSALTDGNTITYVGAMPEDGSIKSITIDLLKGFEIKQIQIWRYYGDSRYYENVKTEVSEDGKVWHVVFDSAVEGTYYETAEGKTIELFTTINLDENGLTIEDSSKNLIKSTDNISVYNNFYEICPATVETLSETFKNQKIVRIGITPDSTQLWDFRSNLWNHGAISSSPYIFKALTKYAISIYWRPVNKPDIVIGMTASNGPPWYDLYTEDIGNGWKRSVGYRNGLEPTEKTSNFFFSFKCPSAQSGEPIYVDWSCPQFEEGRDFATSYMPPEASKKSFLEGLQIPIIKKSFPFTLTMEINPLIKNGVSSNEGIEPEYAYYANAFKNVSGELIGQFERILRSRTETQKSFRYTIVFKDSIFWDSYINDIPLTTNGKYHGMVSFLNVASTGQPFGADGPGYNITEKIGVTAPKGNRVISWIRTGASSGNLYLHGSNILSSKQSKYFSLSFYVKRVDGAPVTNIGSMYMYINKVSDDSRTFSSALPDTIENMGDGWFKVSISRLMTDLSYVTLIGMSSLTTSTEWLICGWELTGDHNRLFELNHFTFGTKGDHSSVGFTNAKYSDITYYDKALTPEDIIKLSDPNFQILSEGDLIVQSVDQKPAYVPKDAYYFPLDTKTSSDTDLILATNKNGIIYDNGAAFVGKAITNLAPNPLTLDSVSWSARENVIVTYNQDDPFGYKNAVKLRPTSLSDNFFGSIYNNLDIGIHTVSIWLKASKPITTTVHIGEVETGASFSFPVDITTDWKEFVYTGQLMSDPTTHTIVLGGWNTWAGTTTDIWLAYPQITKSKFKLPFVNGVSENGYLQYNLNRDIQLDWSKEWTILYHKISIGTTDGNGYDSLTGFSAESLGLSGNTVGGGYLWWGKITGSNNLTASTPSIIDPNQYFNNPRFIVLRKIGTVIQILEYDYFGNVFTRDVVATDVTTPNYYVTQNNFDLYLGGSIHDPSIPTYYKDLIVLKRAMTDEEIDNLFRAHMSFSKDNKILNVSGGITTNKNIE